MNSLTEGQFQEIKKIMGYSGVMLDASKTAPKTKDGRSHLVVWNANVIVDNYGKVWFGDLNITKSETKLKELSLYFKADVYVLREMDGRFENESKPKVEKYVYMTDGKEGVLGGKGVDYPAYYEQIDGKFLSKST